MKPARINIFGASGTGKTTLGRALAARLGVAYLDSDHYFHFPTDPPFAKQRSPEERNRMLADDMRKHGSWVLSGSIMRWNFEPQPDYSLVVFLYLPPEVRLARVFERERRLFGARIEPGGDMEEIHREFRDWTTAYDTGSMADMSSLATHEAYLAKIESPQLRLSQPMTTDEQVAAILKRL